MSGQAVLNSCSDLGCIEGQEPLRCKHVNFDTLLHKMVVQVWNMILKQVGKLRRSILADAIIIASCLGKLEVQELEALLEEVTHAIVEHNLHKHCESFLFGHLQHR